MVISTAGWNEALRQTRGGSIGAAAAINMMPVAPRPPLPAVPQSPVTPAFPQYSAPNFYRYGGGAVEFSGSRGPAAPGPGSQLVGPGGGSATRAASGATAALTRAAPAAIAAPAAPVATAAAGSLALPAAAALAIGAAATAAGELFGRPLPDSDFESLSPGQRQQYCQLAYTSNFGGRGDPRCATAPADIPSESTAGGAIPSPTVVVEGAPPFSGGQSSGVRYRVSIYGQFRVGPYPDGATSTIELNGPIGAIYSTSSGSGQGAGKNWLLPHGGTPGQQNPYYVGFTFDQILAGNLPEFPNPSPNPGSFRVTNAERVDGQPDLGGNPVGPPTQIPATSGPRTVAPALANPPAASPTFAPPAPSPAIPTMPAPPAALPDEAPSAPEPPPGALPSPPVDESRGLPQVTPDARPTGEPAPPARAESTPPPAPGPWTVRQNGQVTQSGTQVELGREITRTTGWQREGRPLDGQQAEEANRLAPPSIPTIIRGLGGAALVGVGINNAAKPGSFTQPEPPRTPPPSVPPTDSPCRCNAPLMNKLDDIDRRLGTLGAGGEAVSTAAILDKLNRMQQYAEKAWQGTRVQKAIDVLTLTTSLHNAYYLSRDVGATIGEMLSLVLDVVGVDDEAGNPLDINTMAGNAIRNAINAALGEQLATNIGNALTRASRIYQSASNVIWTLRSLNDSTTDLLEITANNTGKIGNALKNSKVVDALSYPYFSENYRAGDTMRRRTQQMLDGIEQVDDTVGTLYAATSSVRDIQEEIGALRTAKNQFAAEIGSLAPRDDVPENEPVADAAFASVADSQPPDAEPADLDPADATP